MQRQQKKSRENVESEKSKKKGAAQHGSANANRSHVFRVSSWMSAWVGQRKPFLKCQKRTPQQQHNGGTYLKNGGVWRTSLVWLQPSPLQSTEINTHSMRRKTRVSEGWRIASFNTNTTRRPFFSSFFDFIHPSHSDAISAVKSRSNTATVLKWKTVCKYLLSAVNNVRLNYHRKCCRLVISPYLANFFIRKFNEFWMRLPVLGCPEVRYDNVLHAEGSMASQSCPPLTLIQNSIYKNIFYIFVIFRRWRFWMVGFVLESQALSSPFGFLSKTSPERINKNKI